MIRARKARRELTELPESRATAVIKVRQEQRVTQAGLALKVIRGRVAS